VLKKGVGTPFPYQIKNKIASNSSNKVSIRPQELPHWTFPFHCRLLSSSANLRVTITSVRSQPCFKAVQKGVGTPFPPHYTPEKVQQLDQVCRSRWRLQVSISHPEPVLRLFDLFYQNGSRTYRGASAEKMNVSSLLYILRDLNHYWNVKWTKKRPLHHWNHIMKLFYSLLYAVQMFFSFR